MTTIRSRIAFVFCASLAVVLITISFSERAISRADEKAAAKVVVREDVVYGRVHGAGLLADIAYPESIEPLPAIISVHCGRWVGEHKKDASTIKVKQWAGFGFFAMSISPTLACMPHRRSI